VTEDTPARILFRKAGTLLARRAYSRGELRDKISSGPGSPEEIEETLRRLEDLHLLNDSDYAYNFASNRITQRGWGPVKVYHALVRRQVSPQLAESALERVRGEAGERVWLEGYLEKYWRTRHLPRNRKDVGKLVAHLRRRGFHENAILEVLRHSVPIEVWRSFDAG
jgi:SOS response regulatory protein OraA/RecX